MRTARSYFNDDTPSIRPTSATRSPGGRNPILLGRRVQARVGSALAACGFAAEGGPDNWVRRRAGDIQDWISLPLDLSCGDGPVCVTANLGIYLPRLEAWLARRPELGAPSHWASFTTNIGHLLPDRSWRQWPIASDDAFDWSLGGFVSALVDVGLPWLARFRDLASLGDGFNAFGYEDGRELIRRALGELDSEISDGETSDGVNDARGDFLGRTTQIHAPHHSPPRPGAMASSVPDSLWHCDD